MKKSDDSVELGLMRWEDDGGMVPPDKEASKAAEDGTETMIKKGQLAVGPAELRSAILCACMTAVSAAMQPTVVVALMGGVAAGGLILLACRKK